MSCNYADGLSPYHDKGQLGLEEKFDNKTLVSAKVNLLAKWINEAKHVVVHTGAGISTSAGIPDFRGPRGVWTLQAKGEKPDLSKEFNDAIPTPTHMAITRLVEKGKVKYVVSQNIDGLHLRSNLQRKYLSELHGNMYTEQCNSCNRQFVRSLPVPTVGQKSLNKPCPALKGNGRPCRGRLHDTILDWEHNLPENDLGMADFHSCLADLSICLGTTMQIVPSGNLPLYTKKHGGKFVIVNLQPTKHDKKADLIIHDYVDDVMAMLMKNLNLKIPKYTPKNDPTRSLSSASGKFFEWTISDDTLQQMRKIYEEKCGTKEAKKRLEMIDDDIPLNHTKNLKRKVKEEEDSDLEVLDVIVKPKKKESKRSKKAAALATAAAAAPPPPPPDYNTTITIKKVQPVPKKGKYEGEKITIKKNVTPTKTKYEIVTKPKKVPKCEIVYNTESDVCNDLDMICESDDDDDMTNKFTYNFKRYLYDDVKKEPVKETSEDVKDIQNVEVKVEIKTENDIKKEEDSIKKDPTEVNNVKNQGEEATNSQNINEKKEINDVVEKEKSFENQSNKPTEQENETVNEKTSDDNGSLDKNLEEKQDEKTNEEKNLNQKQTSSQIQEQTPMDVTLDERKQSTEKTIEEKLLENLVKTTESKNSKEENKEVKENINQKTDNIYNNIESELSGLSNTNLESQIDQIVKQAESSQFDSSLTMSTNPSINENYEFYSNDYNTTNNSTDLDYVYNNF